MESRSYSIMNLFSRCNWDLLATDGREAGDGWISLNVRKFSNSLVDEHIHSGTKRPGVSSDSGQDGKLLLGNSVGIVWAAEEETGRLDRSQRFLVKLKTSLEDYVGILETLTSNLRPWATRLLPLRSMHFPYNISFEIVFQDVNWLIVFQDVSMCLFVQWYTVLESWKLAADLHFHSF